MSRGVLKGLACFAGDTVLTAGAGAGKTTALVGFYLALIKGEVDGLEPMSCLDILALTFTEKAAQEMKFRIRAELTAAGLTEEVENLERAPVGTIHGFCSGLIKEFALEAGLDPDFGVIDGGDLLARTATEFVLESLDRGDEDVARLMELMPFGARSGLVACLTESLSLARTMGERPEMLLAHVNRAWQELPGRQILVETDYGSAMAELAAVKLNPKLKCYERLKRAVQSQNRPLDRDQVRFLRAMLQGHVSKNVTPIKNRLLEILKRWERLAAEPEGLRAAEALIRVMGRLEAAYAAAKAALNALDFDDLQLIAREVLFTRPEVRRRLKARIKMILVDEFQDTNPLQWQLIRCLQEVETENRPLVIGDDPAERLTLDRCKLLAVGDAKQSIYRFRGAEVEVFTGLAAELSRSEEGGVVRLTRNYRSQPGLVEFFNRFFVDFLGRAGKPFEAEHTEADCQECGRKGGSNNGCVEFLETPNLKPAEAAREAEAMAVAWRIKELVEQGSPVPLADDRERLGYGDIAILLRKQTQAAALETALRRLSIPYHLVKSGGGLGEPEAVDLVNLLEYLTRPDDLYLLTALLRSPLVGLSDESLCLMAVGGGIERYAGVLADEPKPPLEGDQAAKLARFNALIADLSAWRDRLSPAELMEHVLERTDLGAVLTAGFQGRERLANLQGLIETARSLAGRGGGALFDLVARLRPPDGSPGPIVQPPVREDLDAVKIMTIHKAKGLQFPVVVLAQSGGSRAGRRQAPVLLRPGLGLGLKLKPPRADDWVETDSFHRIKLLEEERDRAEEARLLYVALTRAQDLLIISGPRPGPRDESSWRAALERFAEQDGDGLIRRVEGRTEPAAFVSRAGVGFAVGTDGTSAAARAEGRAIVDRVLSPPRPPGRVEISVSNLEDLALCPRLYLRRRLLQERPPGRNGDSGGLDPTRLGLWLHKMLESIDFARPGDLAEQAAASARALDFEPPPAQQARLIELVERLLVEPAGRRLAALEADRIRRELPFSLALDLAGGLLQVNGEIDLLAETDDGLLIIDWKLARPHGGGREYAFQLMTYGLAVERALGRPPRLELVYLHDQGPTEIDLPFGPAESKEIEARLKDLGAGLLAAAGSLEAEDWPAEPEAGLRPACPYYSAGEGCCG